MRAGAAGIGKHDGAKPQGKGKQILGRAGASDNPPAPACSSQRAYSLSVLMDGFLFAAGIIPITGLRN